MLRYVSLYIKDAHSTIIGAANTSTIVESQSGSPGYQYYQQQDSQYQESIKQYQSPQFYQQRQSPSGPGGTGMVHSNQTPPPGTPHCGGSYQLPENKAKVFSVGDGRVGGSNPYVGVSSGGGVRINLRKIHFSLI